MQFLTHPELLRNNVGVWNPCLTCMQEEQQGLQLEICRNFFPLGGDHSLQTPPLNLSLGSCSQPELQSPDGIAGLVGSLQEVTVHKEQEESR